MLAFRWRAGIYLGTFLAIGISTARGDELLYGYEGNVFPSDPSEAWIVTNACDGNCHEYVEGGYYVAEWATLGGAYSFGRFIPPSPDPPPTLWIEWRFRSNHALGPFFYTCDACFAFSYQDIFDSIFMYGDAAIRFSGSSGIGNLGLNQFHLFRFASVDGAHYTVSVDGTIFVDDVDAEPGGPDLISFGGDPCNGDWIPNMRHSWDFIRYGTIWFGERIVAAEPAMGFLDPQMNADRRSFTVTYDSPNYAYIDDISVEMGCASGPKCPDPPIVIATKRLDNGPPNVIEIVFESASGGLPPGQRTTFTFDDGSGPSGINVVSYTFQHGDVNADGQWNLRDFASLQNCFYTLATTNTCAAFDYDGESIVSSSDFASFMVDFNAIGP